MWLYRGGEREAVGEEKGEAKSVECLEAKRRIRLGWRKLNRKEGNGNLYHRVSEKVRRMRSKTKYDHPTEILDDFILSSG